MHRRTIEEAKYEQLKDFAYRAFEMLKKTVDEDVYEEIELILYKDVYGCHFNKWMLEQALCEMENDDGTTGGHWTVEQTTSVAKNSNINFINFNEYDWNYVMNMMYSDYYKTGGTNSTFYVELARSFLMDKDAPKGKALKYFLAMKK
jgi:hypothetical protein